MRRKDDVSLWLCLHCAPVSTSKVKVTLTFDVETGAQCSTCRGVPSCQCWWYYDYTLAIYGLLGVDVSVWGATSPLSIYRCSSKLLLLRDDGNGQITVFRRKKSTFRKRFSKIWHSCNMLRSLISASVAFYRHIWRSINMHIIISIITACEFDAN